MGTEVLASAMLANGLRNEFTDTYEAIRNRVAESRLAKIMDLGMGATNRQHEFAYFNAAPHMQLWPRGETIPTDAMDGVQFTVPIYEFGRRVPWSKWDRKDDQTDSLLDIARQAGESAALIPERMFFDLLNGTAVTLPAIPNAPDGAAMFSALDGNSQDRFGVSGGNTIAGGGVTAAQILTDYYDAINRFKLFQDGKGQPLLLDGVLEAGVVIVHPIELTEAMEEAFIQKRQIDSGGSTPSNIVQDASRKVELWGTPRLTDANDWFMFLAKPPKQAAFFLDRQGVMEFSSLEEDNNSDSNRDRGTEYVQWESRSGAGVALPYGAVRTTNT